MWALIATLYSSDDLISLGYVSTMIDELVLLDKLANADACNLQEVCSSLARVFHAQTHEVGLLCVRGMSLEFVYPVELKAAGRIPLSSSAVAARTANTRQSELFNNFTQVTHHSVFELVPLGSAARTDFNPNRIHKLMSAPVVDDNGRVVGVIQISRKGPTPDASGPDFVEADLRELETAARQLAPLFKKL